ncbi:hypothetical protein JOC77_002810 [Peribacillus deserti]|uniref:HTH arsR-type domain-containing protein n=1 Tax=Peribacillus deserti TaxID=673318 RepID=A0ABS2QK88_9BACI|nr:metalloregulator ArsR/SmtB family transcription factor [Peribacillus deserti]MBM7693370.1 hypothetical protein [Peribacillus deserti]
MQLDKLVQFHKALADANRIKILVLLSTGPKNGQELAQHLGLTPPTVTHHLTKLREVNLVTDRREKNHIYFYLKESVLKHYSDSITATIIRKGEPEEMEIKPVSSHEEIVKNFFTKEGKLKNLPSQRKKKLMVLYHLAKGIEHGKKYSEKDINEFIKKFHLDYATIRREFIINGIMYRENGIYELNPKEMWKEIK